jgi:hypothetical protein
MPSLMVMTAIPKLAEPRKFFKVSDPEQQLKRLTSFVKSLSFNRMTMKKSNSPPTRREKLMLMKTKIQK